MISIPQKREEFNQAFVPLEYTRQGDRVIYKTSHRNHHTLSLEPKIAMPLLISLKSLRRGSLLLPWTLSISTSRSGGIPQLVVSEII